ncbi:efflux transporter outer membrane subunit [Caulobacter sp. 17J65-9]|uniref:efflux transporter outer membrane subunit n=1 Tax=Caulobacter sp. 17J65-9 TaxID=2709382 RepID=UPI0013C9B1AF|nr:efflux transporter outer membrane subunit [Caulobacter sp. 17J65-9]NEX91454.1 efflux transporter outer membrane subunit [Caulobacter sp. 17J65-9]
MSRPLFALVSASVLALGACAVGPDHKAPVTPISAQGAFVSAAQGPYSAEAPRDDWWRLFQSPALDGLIAEALQKNKDLEIAAANLARVRAVLGESRAARLPSTTLSASGNWGRTAATTTGAPAPLDEVETYGTGLDVSYEVDLFGRVRRSIEAARADADAAEAALDVTRVSVAAETARAFADACSANAQIAVAKRTLELQQETYDLTERQLAAGKGTGLDVARARTQLESARATLPPLNSQRDAALFRLAVLTGKPPAEVPAGVADCAQAPKVASILPVGDGASLLRRRPDVRQAERQLAAASARVGVATASLYPSVVLGGSVGGVAPGVSDLNDDRALHFSAGPLISWSFPNVTVARSRIAQAQAGTDMALAQFDKTVLTALEEVEGALTRYADELERHAALQTARDQSAEATRLARLRYEEGADSFLSVLDAQRSLAVLEAELARSDAELTNQQIALFKALGGGWART